MGTPGCTGGCLVILTILRPRAHTGQEGKVSQKHSGQTHPGTLVALGPYENIWNLGLYYSLASYLRQVPTSLCLHLSDEAVRHGSPDALQGLLCSDVLGQRFPNYKARAVIADDLQSYEK